MSLFYQPNTLTNIFPLNDRNKRTNNHLKQKTRLMRKRERVLRNITNQTACQFDENLDLKKRKVFKNIKQPTNPTVNSKPSSKTNIVVFKEVLKSKKLRIKIKKNKKRTKAKRKKKREKKERQFTKKKKITKKQTKKMAIEEEEEEKKNTQAKTKPKEKKETNKDQEEEPQKDNEINQKLEQILDINKKYEKDPLFVTEYSDEIFEYYKEKEQRFRPNAQYLDEKQPRINSKMRGILVDWLSDVCQEYKLHSETLYLAVNYIDRFLSLNCISKKHLQLLGVTALFIAAKYEEVYPPTVKNFSDITEKSVSKKDIFKCEIKIVNALQFDLSPVTPKPFLKRYLRASQADLKTMLLANYFCEIQLIDSSYLAFLSSQIAASSVALAKMIVTKKSLTQVWDHNMVYYSKYHQNDLKPCIKKLLQSYKKIPKSKLKSAYKKYSLKELKRVSKLIIKKIVI